MAYAGKKRSIQLKFESNFSALPDSLHTGRKLHGGEGREFPASTILGRMAKQQSPTDQVRRIS